MRKQNQIVFQVTFDAVGSQYDNWMSLDRVITTQPQTTYTDIKQATHIFSIRGCVLNNKETIEEKFKPTTIM